MRSFLQRCGLALLTGYIFFYFSEASFAARPIDSTAATDIIITLLAYSFTAYVFLTLLTAFHVRSLVALFLTGAIYGWLTEGVINQTMYLDFPLNISLTGLSWHALITVMLGWYYIPTLLRRRQMKTAMITLFLTGIVYGLWALNWWVDAPPPTPLPVFALYVLVTTAGIVIAYWLASKLQAKQFAPSRAENLIMIVLWLAYFVIVTVQVQPFSLVLLPPLLLLVAFALRHNRKVETRLDLLALSQKEDAISLLRASSAMIIPFTAISVYAIALTLHVYFPTGIILYVITMLLGFVCLIIALIQSFRMFPQKSLIPAIINSSTQPPAQT